MGWGFGNLGSLTQNKSITNIDTVIDGGKITMTLYLEDGSTSVNVIQIENGLPTKITVDGEEIPWTWEGVVPDTGGGNDDTGDGGNTGETLTENILFKGVDNTEVTGGWEFNNCEYGETTVKPTLAFVDDTMKISIQCAHGASVSGGFVTKKQIDFTNISKLIVRFDASINNGSWGASFEVGCNLNPGSWDSHAELITAVENSNSVSNAEVTLDVSSVTGLRYVGFRGICNTAYDGGTNMTLAIKELIME
jgi:hypothetical protein